MCHSETSTWKQTTQAATPTSCGTPNIIELSRLHVMIDHLMVRGPKAEQTPLGLRSVPLQGQERVTRQQSKSSLCPRQRQGWASPSHRRGPRSYSGFSCERTVRGGVQHHHGTMLLATLLDRWPALCKIGWRKVPRDHGAMDGWENRDTGSKSQGSPSLRWRQLPPNSQPRDRV